MKGILLSTAIFMLYVVLTAWLSHILKPVRHTRVFAPSLIATAFLYLGSYLLSPADLGFLPPRLLANYAWLDIALGLLILVLNVHSYVDTFSGLNCGFSTSMMLLLHRAGEKGMTAEDLIANYHGSDGMDKIYGWRIPHLDETGYIHFDRRTGVCTLTGKGRVTALITRLIKRTLNLGAGG